MISKSAKVKTAVVGVGHLGRFHAQKLKVLPQSDFLGVYDASSERAQLVAQELGVKVFASLDEICKEAEACTVASTTTSHYEVCKMLLQNGVHVHVEKPITSTSAEALELCKLAKEKKLKLQVGHVERFNPALIAAKEKLHRPLFIECHRLAPFKPRGVDVNVVLDLMIHDLDMILHLVGDKPTRVEAVGTPVITKVIDIANARIEFANGTVANVTSSRVSLTPQRKFRVFQESQYMSLDFGSGEVRLMTKTGEWNDPAQVPPIQSESWNLEKGDALLAETAAFLDSILQDKPCVVTGEDGLNALQLAETIVDVIEKRSSRKP